ncbi:MAG: sigma-54-dependent Fis family transcriptional regulator [Zetaproteobacteria bacterium]|nr:MAG: sigma-54-dependent Fis family transcriptional regulator [Zetaproteobacteria bacterium]
MADILLVDDDVNARTIFEMGLELLGHRVVSCEGPDSAEQALRSHTFQVVLTDLRMEGRDAGLDVVRTAVRLQPQAKVLLITAYASSETAVAAIKLGAFDYLTKPVSTEELGEAIDRALSEISKDREERQPEDGDEDILAGTSPLIQRVRDRLRRAAASEFTVLITGESGTGKELAARIVHRYSKRASGPFVAINCGAIPSELFESELFGHRRGAFTGAEFDRMGVIEAANGGTLFLDEVGEMPLHMQVKLLRVLQERRVRRVGEETEREIDVRVIAATNRDLPREVQKGNFREDLFYRLNVLPVHMPPLRQRPEDIPAIVAQLLKKWGYDDRSISPGCLRLLQRQPLRGNVRELENLLQRMLALSDGEILDKSLLAEVCAPGEFRQEFDLSLLDGYEHLDALLESLERTLIEQALRQSDGHVTKAAERLGISFRSMRYRMQKLGLKGAGE